MRCYWPSKVSALKKIGTLKYPRSKFETTAKSVYSQPKESKKRYKALKRFQDTSLLY